MNDNVIDIQQHIRARIKEGVDAPNRYRQVEGRPDYTENRPGTNTLECAVNIALLALAVRDNAQNLILEYASDNDGIVAHLIENDFRFQGFIEMAEEIVAICGSKAMAQGFPVDNNISFD